MNTIEIKKMSTIERLQAMEALWDSLMDEESEIESPQWHRDIIEERKRKIENGKAEFISLEELKATRNLYGLRKKYKKEANIRILSIFNFYE